MEYAARCVEDAGFLPVLAHPERYGAVQRDPGCLAEWFGNGWVLQLDKGSVLGISAPLPFVQPPGLWDMGLPMWFPATPTMGKAARQAFSGWRNI